MAEATELVQEMKASIGVNGAPVVHEVSAPAIRLFARAVGYRNPIYYDENAAREQGHPALPAPPGYFGSPRFDPRPARPAAARPAPRGSAFRRTLDGGTEIEPLAPVYAGDVLDAVTALAHVELRDGRLGPMVFRTSETTFTRRSDGVCVARTRRTIISY